MTNWFDVDKEGLAKVLDRRGKSWALYELVQNAWDSGAKTVEITLKAVEGQPLAVLSVGDDSPDGWADLTTAFTLFGRSAKSADPTKRGRFCFGEKMVLALCKGATIITTNGGIVFDGEGRHKIARTTVVGTLVDSMAYGATPETNNIEERMAGSDLRFSYEIVEVAKRMDGQTVRRHLDQWSCGGELMGDPKTSMPERDKSYNPRLDSPPEGVSVLACTPENLAALESIKTALDTLGNRLLTLLSPTVAQKTLTSVAKSGVKLLTEHKGTK